VLTAKSLLQMGYDCGLDDVEAVYSMVMCHYDAFFRIKFIEHDTSEFLWMLKEAGFIRFYMGKGTWIKGTIQEHAARLGIELEEPYLYEPYDGTALLEEFISDNL